MRGLICDVNYYERHVNMRHGPINVNDVSAFSSISSPRQAMNSTPKTFLRSKLIHT